MYEQVDFIKDTHQQSKIIENLIDSRLKSILSKVEEVDMMVGQK